MRIVLDTNVLMSGIFFGGAPGRIIAAWRAGRVAVVAAPAILDEYLAVADELGARYPTVDVAPLMDWVTAHLHLVPDPSVLPRRCRDPDDDRFLACADAAGAVAIVSGDRDLLVLADQATVAVLTPRQFVDQYLKRK